jgi:hypothetical protein
LKVDQFMAVSMTGRMVFIGMLFTMPPANLFPRSTCGERINDAG